MAPLPCSHSLPVSASTILYLLLRCFCAQCGCCRIGAPMLRCARRAVLLACSSLAAPDAATGRSFSLHGALACRRHVWPLISGRAGMRKLVLDSVRLARSCSEWHRRSTRTSQHGTCCACPTSYRPSTRRARCRAATRARSTGSGARRCARRTRRGAARASRASSTPTSARPRRRG